VLTPLLIFLRMCIFEPKSGSLFSSMNGAQRAELWPGAKGLGKRAQRAGSQGARQQRTFGA